MSLLRGRDGDNLELYVQSKNLLLEIIDRLGSWLEVVLLTSWNCFLVTVWILLIKFSLIYLYLDKVKIIT